MNWNKWMRLSHRWLSIAFTIGVIVNGIAVAMAKFTPAIGLLAGVPLALLLISGLYLFALPYAARWRSGRHAS